MLDYAKQGRTTHPILSNLILVRKINDLCGTAIKPWELDEIADDWLDGVRGMVDELPELVRGLREVEEAQQRIRLQHGNKYA